MRPVGQIISSETLGEIREVQSEHNWCWGLKDPYLSFLPQLIEDGHGIILRVAKVEGQDQKYIPEGQIRYCLLFLVQDTALAVRNSSIR